VNPAPATQEYDVIIIGGAMAGAASAFILKQENPALRVLILDRRDAHKRRVGEATIEISTYFLTRVLGLTKYLNEAHLNKHGLRFWFSNEKTKTIADSAEIGGKYWSRVPAYLVDRATLDEEVLRRAVEAGAKLIRPATVSEIKLQSGGQQQVFAKVDEQAQTFTARWVIDASGVAALLARQEGWWRRNEGHPTATVWSRWRGVKDWESLELRKRFPQWAKSCHGQRGAATNHLMGRGWWAWWIPLKGGDVSIGVVYDQRIMELPEGGRPSERLKSFLMQHPVGAEMMRDAECVEGDVHTRRHLAYYSTTFAGDGFALVSDAAGFLDPFYSPGLDWLSFSVSSATNLILAQKRGDAVAPLVERMNHDYNRSYHRWFAAIYQDKYYYMGEFDLLRTAFLMDLGLYYHGVASQPFRRGNIALLEPYYSTPPSTPFYHFMRTYNRRFARMAQSRFERGIAGQKNDHRRYMFPGYTFELGSMKFILKAALYWGWLELTEGWRTWFIAHDPSKSMDEAAKNSPIAATTAKAVAQTTVL
jgi:flavin-dependent dehydrogenase